MEIYVSDGKVENIERAQCTSEGSKSVKCRRDVFPQHGTNTTFSLCIHVHW